MSNLFSSGGAGNVGFSGETQQSLKFNDDESQYLSWTPAAAGNRKTWTWSGWVKRGNLVVNSSLFSAAGNYYDLRFTTSDTLLFYGNGSDLNFQTTTVYRDPSAWYHVVVALDTTQSTALDRVKIYVNGEQQTSFSSSVSALNAELAYNNTVAHAIGRRESTSNFYADSYLSDINFIDGQALDPTSFGQFTNGYWEKKDYAGSYGTNGFHLTFQDDVVSEGFNTVTYRGTGVTNSVSGLGFSPDLVWIKGRNIAYNHRIYDTVRGVNKRLYSDLNNDEYTSTQSVMSFDADGFTLGTDAGENNGTTPGSFVSWCWDAGSGSPVSNTDGTITATVKANPAYGFSIISYTGNSVNNSTIGTGLNSEAEMVIIKNRTDDTANDSWPVWHKDIGTGKYLSLSTTNAAATSGVWNDGGFTNDVISISSWNGINKSGTTYIGYAWHSVAGYSSIGSYSGNGSTSGPTVTTGFRPAFVMFKNADGADDWVILDSTRNPSNPVNSPLFPSGSYAEETNANRQIEISDTGFQVTSSGQWINGSGQKIIYMAFADTREAAFWKDVSGQGNHWTPNNLDYRDSVIDSPANNWCTLNPLYSSTSTSYPTPVLSEGNLAASTNSGSNWKTVPTTMYMSTGKWYAEVKVTYTDAVDSFIGFASNEFNGQNYAPSETAFGYQFHPTLGIRHNSTQLSAQTFTQGDIIGLALNMDDNEIKFYKNGSLLYTATSVAAGSWSVALTLLYTKTLYANFGQDSTFSGATPAGGNQDDNGVGDFKYAPPSGYLALCTANLPTPTIVDGSEHFNTLLWSGDAAQTRSLSGLGFQPDFSWLKIRSGTTQDHQLYDVVRGAGSGKSLSSNTSAVEGTVNGFSDGDYGYLSSFDADGFSVDDGAVATTGGYVNYSGRTYAAWNWKAGGTAVSNTDGSITSQVSANTDSGFSIVSYTGTGVNATVGHGLSSAPELLIVRRTNSVANWTVGHFPELGNGKYLKLNTTDSQITPSNPASVWNSTSPTSTLVSIGTSSATNLSSGDYIAYCFHSSDVCKVGSYTGNGSSDGPFIYTGFRPAWVMVKKSSATGNWLLHDTVRDPFNPIENRIYPNLSDAELDAVAFDSVSNGFKIRNVSSGLNTNGATIIYLAFASSPFKYANAR